MNRLRRFALLGIRSGALDGEAEKRPLIVVRQLDCPQAVSSLRHSRVKVPALSTPISLFLGPPSLLTLSLSRFALKVGDVTAQAALKSMFSAVRCSVT